MDYSRCTRSALFLFGVSSLAAGCALELDYGPPTDGSADAFGDASGNVLDAFVPRDAGDAGVVVDAALDTSLPDANDAGPVECVADADCDLAYGAPPCGAWVCAANTCGVVCASCTDADLDGYGVGTGCAGLDCDDTDDTVTDTGVRGCAPSGGTAGVGVCHDGTETCSAGTWGACLGAQSASPESCNGLDDDCDGTIDDGFGMVSCGVGACTTNAAICVSGAIAACRPATAPTTVDGCGAGDEDCDGRIDENCSDCVWVSTTGSNASPTPRMVTTPFATVQAAIDFAAVDPALGLRVCLLSNGCSSGNAVFNGAVRMASGVHVQGNYAPGGASLCASGVHTEIRTGDATGVLFDDTITRHTQLADVVITPSTTSTPSSASVGVTVDAANGAVISGVWVLPTSANVANGYGVDVRNGGDAIVTRSVIYGGHATGESVGVRVEGARATIVDNCPVALDAAGRCPAGCANSGSVGIRGRSDSGSPRATTSYAILLRDAPGSIVQTSATCGQIGLDGAGIRIDGAGDGIVVRGNFIPGFGPQNASYGIDIASCGGDSPLVTGNAEINAEGPMSTPAVAIRSVGDCHPILENNARIVSGLEGSMISTAILCGADPSSGVSSRCVIEGNPFVRAAGGGFPVTATGVSCELDACARIVLNDISGTQGGTVVGLRLGTAQALVARNRIVGGCGSTSATGIVAVNGRARVEDNLVFGGGACLAGMLGAGPRQVGMALSATDATYAIDVHGNDVDPATAVTAGAACASRGIELTGHPGVDVGVLRGNIVLAGACAVAYPLFEVDANSDPVALEHNVLFPNSGRPVYRDEGTTDVATAAMVDALGDTALGGNQDTSPGFVNYPTDLHLTAASMCIDADMSVGAPLVDYDGRARTSTPDIGAYER